MTESECIPYAQTGFFSKLITHYLEENPALKNFHHRFPKESDFAAQMADKSQFSSSKRQILIESLKRQYQNAQIDVEGKVLSNIEALADANTFTVTTGHQLNILTGPLYFIYKIISTLNLAERLHNAHPQKRVVPVYWMASEDHDFEEINHIHFYGGKLSWHNDLKGAVGHMPTFGMGKVLDELEEHLGPGKNAAEILALFREAYHERENIAQATRYVVHQLFKKYGLLILDGDDPDLKAQMKSIFKDDLLQHNAQKKVALSSEALEKDYFAQVYPRAINLFYLKKGVRERIEKRNDLWVVLNTEISFSKDQLLQELEQHPERFSPNVVLRPLYQEVILPNLAYIGGGGELAYWFQLKAMFDHFQVPFPMLVLRNSVLWVSEKWQHRAADLDLPLTAFFQNMDQLQKELAQRSAPVDPELNAYHQKLQRIFDELEEVAHLTDESMLGAVNAQRQKQLNGLEKLKKKLVRAEKRKHSTVMEKVARIHKALFPQGGLQERHDNLSVYYADYGPKFIDVLKESLNPLDFRFTVLKA